MLHEEWIEKAEGDYKTAVIIHRPRKEPQYDAVCYHCQQSAEKYLKAYLIQQGAIPRRNFPVSTTWPNRLERCEVDLSGDVIRVYGLRRQEPEQQRLLREWKYRILTRAIRKLHKESDRDQMGQA